ncbi:MAG: hypothetical protein NWF04_07325 [Candidatus Bathyarchaeota archaeon]|nr:hypothetical protein [Candidatus Bathyarchaeota archaeon]
MKNSLLGALLIVVLLSGFAFCCFVSVVCAQDSTFVSGILASDTVWTKEDSPYVLTGSVLVSEGVTLTIESGVIVDFTNYYLHVNGTLHARGNSSNSIRFIDSNQSVISHNEKILFSLASVAWDEQTGLGCIIENAFFEEVTLHIEDASPKINNNTFTGLTYYTVIDISGITSSPLITNNNLQFSNVGMSVKWGSPTISGNIFSGNRHNTGISVSGPLSLFNNTITDCWDGIVGGSVVLEGNKITNNVYGTKIGSQSTFLCNEISNNKYGIFGGGGSIKNNTISNNVVGIQAPDASSVIMYNNFYDNNDSSICLGSGEDLAAAYNWWGTTDIQAINQTIYDFKNDFTLGTVDFVPFSEEPNIVTLDFDLFEPSSGPTFVAGMITLDTTWNRAGSPYILTGPVVVNSGVTLTIDPGVTVGLAGYSLQVNGTLTARGNDAEKIVLNDGHVDFKYSATAWDAITDSGCIIENAVLNFTAVLSDVSLKLNNNYITGKVEINGGKLEFTNNNLFSPTFGSNGVRIANDASAYINNNVICSFFNGVDIASSGTATITHNLIIKGINGIRISNFYASANIQNNTLTQNMWGLYVTSIPDSIVILGNNIFGNTQRSVDLSPSQNIGVFGAIYNWWGTTDTQTIDQSIVDFKDDFNLGTVEYLPLLNEPNPTAPQASSVPDPTPTPTPTLMPTITPTPTPIPASATPNPTPTPTSTPSPTPTPEFTSLNVQLDRRYDGQAVFSNEKTHASPYSARLNIPVNAAAGSWAIALYPCSVNLVSAGSFSVYASYFNAVPRFLLYLDQDNDGFSDRVLLSPTQPPHNGEWAAITNTDGVWSAAVNSLSGHEDTWEPLTYWQDIYSNAMVLFIGVAIDYDSVSSNGIGEPLYADELMLNGVTYTIASVHTTTPDPQQSPTPPPPAAPFWSLTTILFTVGLIGVTGAVVSVPAIRVYRKNIGNVLYARADKMLQKDKPFSALKLYAKACLAYIKINQPQTATQALTKYTTLAKSLTLQTLMSRSKNKTSKITQLTKTNLHFNNKLNNKKARVLIQDSDIEKIHSLKTLLSRANSGDMDFVVNQVLQDPTFMEPLLQTLKDVDHISVDTLAFQLQYNTDATMKLLAKSMETQKIEGVFSNDNQHYISKSYIRKYLLSTLNPQA